MTEFLKTLPQKTEGEPVEIHAAEPLITELTSQQVATAMNKLTNNKAQSNDQIRAELIFRIANRCQIGGMTRLVPIFKKADEIVLK